MLSRNTILLVGVILAGQVIAGLLLQLMVIGPQTERVANVTADAVAAMSTAMRELPESEKTSLIERLNSNGQLLVRPLSSPPSDGHRYPSYLEISFMRVLAGRLGHNGQLDWRTDTGDRLWLRLRLGGEDYWMSVTPPRQRSAMASVLLALSVAFVVASIAGLMLQRWLDRPLRRLAGAVDRFDLQGAAPAVIVEGPREVALVAGAFLGLTERLNQHEADRALMLAGVSHDLRTPLTRLRLSIELMRDCDPELLATAVRQTERMEAMLGQFLDFARGFEAEPLVSVDIDSRLRALIEDMAWEDLVSVVVPRRIVMVTRPFALERAVANLLVNAIRHGAPPVVLFAGRQQSKIEIAVTDHGTGIDANALAGLLRPFAQGEAARGRDGTGLGLAIAERAVRALGGTLSFESLRPGFKAVIELPDRSMG